MLRWQQLYRLLFIRMNHNFQIPCCLYFNEEYWNASLYHPLLELIPWNAGRSNISVTLSITCTVQSQTIWIPPHFLLKDGRSVLGSYCYTCGKFRRGICVSCCRPSFICLLFLCNARPAHCGSCLLTGWPLTSCWHETWIQLLLKTVRCLGGTNEAWTTGVNPRHHAPEYNMNLFILYPINL